MLPALKEMEEKMRKSVEAMRREFATVRTGRASAALLDHVTVDYYGAPTPLKQLAGVSAPEPRLLVIQPFDPSIAADIEKAILKSDLGLTPSNDGRIIRIPIPPLSEERRKELVKVVHRMAEDARVAVRNVRRETKERLENMCKSGELPEDDAEKAKKTMQEITDKYVGEIDADLKIKEEEILEA